MSDITANAFIMRDRTIPLDFHTTGTFSSPEEDVIFFNDPILSASANCASFYEAVRTTILENIEVSTRSEKVLFWRGNSHDFYTDPNNLSTGSITGGLYIAHRVWIEGSSILLETDLPETNTALHQSDRCKAAIESLKNIEEDLEENDVSPPDRLVAEVEALLLRLFHQMDLPVYVHAMPEGDIVVNISPNRRDLVFIHCDANGSAYCMTKVNNKRSTRKYRSTSLLPDNFVNEVLHRFSESSR